MVDVVAEHAAAAHTKGIGLHLRMCDQLPMVVGDARLVRQTLTHLVENALRFTPKGQVDVAVNCDRTKGEDLKVECIVRDTGVGIKDRDQARIFERFAQIGSGHTNSGAGTGLGLSLAQAYADLMGGTITVNSTIGAGSTFTLGLTFHPVQGSKHHAPVA